MSYVFDISGFKAFLLKDTDRFRIDGLSIWHNSIPIPVDLFENFFDQWRENFKIYLDHIMAALMLEEILESSDLGLSIDDFPDINATERNKPRLFQILTELKNTKAEFKSLAQELAQIVSVENYSLEINDLLAAASMGGKKYKRLFLPKHFRHIIKMSLPNSLTAVATSNGDMFGNIIADRLKLYRAGFGDALAGIFNKLLEYKIDKCSGYIAATSSSTLNFGDGVKKDISVIKEKTTDGSLWEPLFDGEIKIRLNPSHPHYKVITECGNPNAVIKILGVMAKLEMNSSNSNDLKNLENMRTRISRELWISE